MIDAPRLLKDLQRIVKELEEDLRERSSDEPEVDAWLRAQYREARDAGRTGQAFELWRDEFLTQVAVAWILACVFVRFMEDNDLVETPRLSGPGERRQRALDQHELYFKSTERRTHSDREYLLDVFEQTRKLPAARELFDANHNPLWAVGLSGDGATKLLQFWQRRNPDTGALEHDFTDPDWNTRFLGDLYQDLSESARKKYALLQTPEFVEEFILDRTLTPAIEEFGFQEVRLIDPTCGSGHFLLGAFHRLFDLWLRHEPDTNSRELVQRALGQVYGVDLNPYAVAIAKFRMLVAALEASGVKRMADAPGFHLNLAVGDSLLHGRRFHDPMRGTQPTLDPAADPIRHVYETEDRDALARILGQQYQVVVGNPPYINPNDDRLNQAYRDRFGSCHKRYSLAVPFTERFFELAQDDDVPGFVGMITANSFMTRDFGEKLITQFLPKWDLTHVVDLSFVPVPGHDTSTVMLFGRNRAPLLPTTRTVVGVRGLSSPPKDPATCAPWLAVVRAVDSGRDESEFVSVEDSPRSLLSKHPWSLGGGQAGALKALIEDSCNQVLGDMTKEIGRTTHTGEDDAYLLTPAAARAKGVGDYCLPFVLGEDVREWGVRDDHLAILPRSQKNGEPLESLPVSLERHFWPLRTTLRARRDFGKTPEERGLAWYDHSMFFPERFRANACIAIGEMASHNHFALSLRRRVFNRSAPVIILPQSELHPPLQALLGYLNSSIVCFWLRQVCHPKGGDRVAGGEARIRKNLWEERYVFSRSNLLRLPLPAKLETKISTEMKDLADAVLDFEWLRLALERGSLQAEIPTARQQFQAAFFRMVLLQEELDWHYYERLGLANGLGYADNTPSGIMLGERAFEIRLARSMDDDSQAASWFARHRSTPKADVPSKWPAGYQRLVEARIKQVEASQELALLERPEHKRRWNLKDWDAEVLNRVREWLLDRIEAIAQSDGIQSCARIAEEVRTDELFINAALFYRGREDFDVHALVSELVLAESVPALPALRFESSGLRKHEVWKRTWEQQRIEDEIDQRNSLPSSDSEYLSDAEARAEKIRQLDKVAVPPKFRASDFKSADIRRLRGKLDVPKERFVCLPNCERDADPSLPVIWAGLDHLKQAQSVAEYYVDMREREGWSPERLMPLLCVLVELLPWIRQWHNDLDSSYGVRMGDYFDDFINQEARSLGLSIEQIESWTPPAKTDRADRKRGATQKGVIETEEKPA